MGANIT